VQLRVEPFVIHVVLSASAQGVLLPAMQALGVFLPVDLFRWPRTRNTPAFRTHLVLPAHLWGFDFTGAIWASHGRNTTTMLGTL
jgi:hypothetical protein